MSGFTPSLDRLIEQFAKLPSVGKKSAQRLAFHILSMSDSDAKAFTETIEKAKEETSPLENLKNKINKFNNN